MGGSSRKPPTDRTLNCNGSFPGMTEANSEARILTVRFDAFGWRVLGEHARAGGRSAEDVLADACTLLVARLDAADPPPEVPRFKKPAGTVQDTPVVLEPDAWASLDAEAERAQVPLERLVEHAAFVYLQATDSPGSAAG